ncbi:MAG TPA: rhodanese-like domain-containing protein [Alphaproteobacteria bacterium]|jgi:rhodanese-related sulfurtransferase|nr:rhodanese-like domain-containing protein [Alphaproteobacteria bacterium]
MSKSILYLLIIGFFSCTISKVELKSISVLDLQNKLKNENSIMVIDVRTESEFDGPLGHIANSKLKPLSNISQTIMDLKTIGDKPVYVVCRSGNRSTTATMKLRTEGINAINVEGGMKAWNKIIK